MDRKKYCSYYFKILDIKKLIIYTEQTKNVYNKNIQFSTFITIKSCIFHIH